MLADVDPSVTDRTLEFWRHEGLLPRPERIAQNGKTPIWTHPPETMSQLRALLRLRRQTRELNVLRAALWFEGYSIDVSRVRRSISAYLRHVRDVFERELDEHLPTGDKPGGRQESIRALAQVLARKRGNGIPRLSRQPLDERTDAIAVMLTLVLGEEPVSADLQAHGNAVERFIGVDHGRRYHLGEAGPWLDGAPADGLRGFAAAGSLPRLIAVMESATDEDLQSARRLGVTFLGGISAFSRMADAMVGRHNASGMAGMALFAGDRPDAFLIVPLMVSLLKTSEHAMNLRQMADILEGNVLPVEARIREIAALPNAEQSEKLKHLDKLPFIDQLGLKRLLNDLKPEDPGR